MSVLRVFTILGLCLPCLFSVYGDDAPASGATPQTKTEISVADVEQLLKQLDADEFDQREAASKALREAGIGNLPQLEKTIAGESLEAASRAYDIVVYFHEKGNATDKAAATEALKRIAAGENSAAMRAKQLLEKPTTPSAPGQLPGRVIIRGMGGLPMVPAGIDMEAFAIGGKNVQQSVSVSMRDGEKTLKFSNNDQKIELTESADKSIKGQMTQKKEDKDTTEKIEVKNADELKEKFPAAHKIYEKYILKKGGAGGIEVRIEALEGGVDGLKQLDLEALKLKQLDALKKSMQKLEERFNDFPEEAKAKIRELQEQQIQKLEEDLKGIEEKIEAKDLEKKAE